MKHHYLWDLRPYFRQVAGQLALGSLAGVVMNTAVVLPSILLGRAVDAVRALEQGQADTGAVTWAALALVGGTLLTELPRILKRWWLQTANARIRANVRADCVRGLFSWPMERLHQAPIGDLMARIIGDVEVLGVGVREFTIELWDTVLFSISFVAAMLVFDWRLSILALLPVPAAMLLAHAVGRWVRSRTTAAREANGALTTALQEQLAGIRVLRLFGRGTAALARVEALSRRYADTNLAVVRLQGGLQPVYNVLMTAGIVFVVWQGSERVLSGAMTLGGFVAYLGLFLRFVGRGFRVPQLVNSVQTGGAAYARLRPLLAPPLTVSGEPPFASFYPGHVAGSGTADGRRPTVERSGPPSVVLDNVAFRYPGAETPALDGVSLDMPPGALVAVTGPVGSGKSALARAIVGVYPVESGAVLLDGRPAETFTPAERAARIGYLPQDAYLFSGTVRENVLLAQSAEDHPSGSQREAALQRAVRLAALDGDLRTFPQGLETEIGELGIRVSGGQRQRIALARALAAAAADHSLAHMAGGSPAPGLLVLDDPFSAVDVDTEVRIASALREAFGPAAPPAARASIQLCSHRMASFPQADHVVVLDRGRIVEQGTHDTLVRAGGLYARIYRAQRQVEQDGSAAPRAPVQGAAMPGRATA